MLNPLRALTLGGLLLFSSLGHAAPAAPDALRIGYQKGSVSMVLAKSHQLLEQRYPQTVVVKFFWTRRSDGRVMHRRATGRQ
ncbi:hypothetical protein ACUTGE_21985, partial [Klebsiella pneumoniae]